MTKTMNKLRTALTALALVGAVLLSGCATDADVASRNLSKSAEMFEVPRRVVFFNGITDAYLLSIEGLCSIDADSVDSQLEVTCKTGDGEFKKHFLGLSDNVTYFVEQLDPSGVSDTRYRVIFKPSIIIPDIDIN